VALKIFVLADIEAPKKGVTIKRTKTKLRSSRIWTLWGVTHVDEEEVLAAKKATLAFKNPTRVSYRNFHFITLLLQVLIFKFFRKERL